jgi:hypothetical protein
MDVPVMVRICPVCADPETLVIVGVAPNARPGRHASPNRHRQNKHEILITALIKWY